LASFVEQAVLLLDDSNVVAKINRINAALSRMHALARSMRNMNVNLNGLAQAERNVARLNGQLNRLKSQRVTINPRVNTSAAETAIRNLTRARTMNVTVRTTTTDSGPRPRTPPPSSQVVSQGPTRMGTFASRVTADIAASSISQLASAIGRAIREGTREADVADTALDMRQLTDRERTQSEQGLQLIRDRMQARPQGALLTDAQRRQLLAENIGVTGGDVGGALQLTELAEPLIQFMVANGRMFNEALSDVVAFSKAGEQSGQFQGADGRVDPGRATAYFDFARQGVIAIGKEFSGAFMQGAIRNLRSSKLTLDREGLMTVLLLNEEQGTMGSTGTNQMIKQLSGERVQKKQLANMVELGLMLTRQVPAGEVGGKQITETVSDGVVDEEILRTNPLEWVGKHLIPILEKRGDLEGAVDTSAERVAVARLAGEITSDRTATEALVTLMNRYASLLAQADRALATDVSAETTDPMLERSSTLGLAALQNQFSGLMGQVINNLEPIILPAVQGAADTLASLAAKASAPDATFGDQALATAAAGAAVIPLGLAAGIQGLMDPATRPLSAAGLALTGSAAALTASAAALKGAAVAQGVGGLGGGVDGKGGKGAGGFARLAVLLRGGGYALLGAMAAIEAGQNMSTPEDAQRHFDRMGEREGWWNRAIERLADAIGGEGTAEKIFTTQDELDRRVAKSKAELASVQAQRMIVENEERKRATSKAAAEAAGRRERDDLDMRAIRLMQQDDARSEAIKMADERSTRFDARDTQAMEDSLTFAAKALQSIAEDAGRKTREDEARKAQGEDAGGAFEKMLEGVGSSAREIQQTFGIAPETAAPGATVAPTSTALTPPVAMQQAVAQGGAQGGMTAADMIRAAHATGAQLIAAAIAAAAAGINVKVSTTAPAPAANTGSRGPK
jgi:hypothetical protein